MTRIDCGPLEEFPSGTARRVDAGSFAVAVVRCADAVYAIGDRCTHADISLSEGEVSCEDATLECWKHGSTFSLLDGQPLSLPATKPVATYATGIDGGRVWVQVDG
ncbi:MAG: Rieske (2Fe-2S) protein [Acidimicrobiales bacterium]